MSLDVAPAVLVSPDAQSPALIAWRRDVTALALLSSRLVLGLCIAFAAPVWATLRRRPLLFHLYGSELSGRLAAVDLAACLYGDTRGVRTWAEVVADPAGVGVDTDDGFLPVYRMGECDMHSLAGAAGRIWLDRKGGPPPAVQPALTLSTGGMLFDPMHVNLIAGAGKVRILNIPADVGSGSVYDSIFSPPLAATISKVLVSGAAAAGGAAGLAWLRHLTRMHGAFEPSGVGDVDEHAGAFDQFTSLRHDEVEATFGIVATCGEVATAIGLTGWSAGDAYRAVDRCRQSWQDANERRLRSLLR